MIVLETHTANDPAAAYRAALLQRMEVLLTENHPPAFRCDNVLEAIVQYCLTTAVRLPVSPRRLDLLLLRGLQAAGEINAARTVARHMGMPALADWMQQTGDLTGLSARLWEMIALGILCCSQSCMADRGTFWVVDFRHIRLTGADRVELALFAAARQIIESLAQVWDSASGAGTLGLKGLDTWQKLSGKKMTTSALTLPHYMRQVLEQIQVRRAWQTCPLLVQV